MDSAEKAGKKFTGGNMAYYATKAARRGRRSFYTGRSDVMSPGCQIDGKARHRIAIIVLVRGGTMHEDGKRCGLKDSAALSLKCRIAADLIESFDQSCTWQPVSDPFNDALKRPTQKASSSSSQSVQLLRETR